MQDAPLIIAATRIVGAQHTRPDTIEAYLQDAYEADTFAGIANELLAARQRLAALDIFESVHLELGPRAPGETELIVTVKEKRLVTAKATTFIESGEPGFEVAGRLGNALGRAEYAQFSVIKGRTETGAPRRTTLGFEAAQPFLAWGAPLLLQATADHSSARPQGNPPYEIISTGIGLHLNATRGIRLEWNSRLRDVLPDRELSDPFAFAAPREIVAQAVPSHKSALSASISLSSMDSPTPSHGTQLHARFEVAHPRLLGGDVGQVSATLRTSTATPLTKSLFLVLSGELATVQPAFGDANPVPLVDRLFLGGPMGLKGFQHRGAGPRSSDGKAALGGTTRWQAKAAVESNPPMALPFQARTHVFVAMGALDEIIPRATVGAGVVLPVPFGRLEVNGVMPVWTRSGDVLSGRLQVGFGMDFM